MILNLQSPCDFGVWIFVTSLESQEYYLANQRASQSARAKSTVHLCGIHVYSASSLEGFQWISYQQKAHWHYELETFFIWTFEWYSHANKIQLHKKTFAFSLVLKVRVFVTQKWPNAGKTAAHKEHHCKTSTHFPGWAFPVKFKVTLSRQSLPSSASFSVLHAFCCSASSRVFDHFVVLKLLLWITRQRSLKYLVH